jgi:hypothetical protein
MNVSEAKSQIIELLTSQLGKGQFTQIVNPTSPDQGDTGKFSILSLPARAIHRSDGWHIPINLDWFSGSLDLPTIGGGEFYWYAIAIPEYSGFTKPHYLICDYVTIRAWALEFISPPGIDYRDQRYWRADIEQYKESKSENMAYFRWGDEPPDIHDKPSRIVLLDNIIQIAPLQSSAPRGPRMTTEVSRVARDTNVVKILKTLYGNKCQVCGTTIGLPGNEYSEAHHIKPLGQPHNGPDVTGNVLILCPNHHVEFDLGYIAINPDTMTILHLDPQNEFNGSRLHVAKAHDLAAEFLLYHRKAIFGGPERQEL